MGGILFDPIYWQTACLLQRSGSLDGKSTDYNKIAKAVALTSKQGVKIKPIDINKSGKDFEADVENHTIYFGLAGVKGLKSKVIDAIFAERPFNSLQDFLIKTKADITSTVALIKAGAFDEFGDKNAVINELGLLKADLKKKLNGQNLMMISRLGLWPTSTSELQESLRFFNVTQYMKTNPNGRIFTLGYDIKEYYQLDERSTAFLDEFNIPHDEWAISKTSWKPVYDVKMIPIKDYLKENQIEMLDEVNSKIFMDWREKYFSGNNISQWEIETLGLCFGKHPMADIENIDNFFDLPAEPEINNFFTTKNGRTVPLYKLTMIAGIVIAKDKLHSSITLLTAEGPVEVKFRKQQFASYDAQISKVIDGKKKIIERSWLNRGVGLIIHGMRQNDEFIAKTYRNSPMKHTAYKIIGYLPNGKFEVKKEREKGKEEEVIDD